MRLVTIGLVLSMSVPTATTLASDRMSPGRASTLAGNWQETLMPLFRDGRLFQYGSEDGDVTVYSFPNGNRKLEVQTSIRPEGASIVHISDAAAASGAFVISAWAATASGQGSTYLTFFGAGRPQLYLQLPNMLAFRLVSVADGTVWALVQQVDSSGYELTDYDMLRHYSSAGKFLGTALPRSRFPVERSGSNIKPLFIRPFLSASKDTVGLYLDLAGLWVELGLDGRLKGQWLAPKTQMTSGRRIRHDRLDLTNSNQIVRTTFISGKQKSDYVTRMERLHKSGDSLVPTIIETSDLPQRQAWLAGVDGEQFIWIYGREILWSKLN